MSPQINQPSNQIKLTNVSIVRLRKAKKRFEVACYKNKMLEYRQGIEKDLDSVLQISQVFLNVSKGQTASKADLEKAFGKGVPTDKIVEEILERGEVQVGEGERKEQLERIKAEVVSIVADKVVDPRTGKVYSPVIIEQALELVIRESGRLKSVAAAAAAEAAASAGAGDSSGEGPGLSTDAATADKDQGKGKKKVSGKRRRKGKGKENHKASGTTSKPGDHDESKHASDYMEKNDENDSQKKDGYTTAPLPPTEELASTSIAGPSPTSGTNTPSRTPAASQKKATWTGVVATRSAKAQAQDAIRALVSQQPIPVIRARLKIKISAPGIAMKTATREQILELFDEKESEDFGGGRGEWEIVGFVDSGAHRTVTELMAGKEFRGRGRVEVLERGREDGD